MFAPISHWVSQTAILFDSWAQDGLLRYHSLWWVCPFLSFCLSFYIWKITIDFRSYCSKVEVHTSHPFAQGHIRTRRVGWSGPHLSSKSPVITISCSDTNFDMDTARELAVQTWFHSRLSLKNQTCTSVYCGSSKDCRACPGSAGVRASVYAEIETPVVFESIPVELDVSVWHYRNDD